MAIITRQTGPNAKGSPLTADEMDANLGVLQDISSSFTSVSASISNLSSLSGTLSGQFTGSVLVSGSARFTSASIQFVNSNKVLVYEQAENGVIGWNTVSGVGTSGTSGVNGTFFGTNGTSGINGGVGLPGSSGTSGLTISNDSYATTGSNTFIGNQSITGSLSVSAGEFNVTTGSGNMTSSLIFDHTQNDGVTLGLRHNDRLSFADHTFNVNVWAAGVYTTFVRNGTPYSILNVEAFDDNKIYLYRDTRLYNKSLTIDKELLVKQGAKITGSLSVISGSGDLTSSIGFLPVDYDLTQGASVFEVRHTNNIYPEKLALKLSVNDIAGTLFFEKNGSVYNVLQVGGNSNNLFISRDTRLLGKGLTVDESLLVKGVITGSLLATNGVVSSSNQIQNYNVFPLTASANTFWGDQTINGSVNIDNSLTASLREGYIWVGGNTNKNTLQVATSSLGGGAGVNVTGADIDDGIATNVGAAPGGFNIESNLKFNGSLLTVNGNISASGVFTASLASGYAWVGGIGNRATLVATSSFGGGTATTDGIFRTTGSVVATTNNVQITGSLDINGHMTASLRQGYAWVGGVTNKNTLQIPTSSFGTSLTILDGIPSPPVSAVTQITFAGGTVTNQGNGAITVTIAGGGGGSAGTSGTSGVSGEQGSTGTNGTSGTSGVNGFGSSGTSGANGSSGTSGLNGAGGVNGSAGSSGTSGVSGNNGLPGIDGTDGTSGVSGTSGVDAAGSNGTSGVSGTSGSSGISGGGGSSGTSGVNGSAGTNGLLALSGTTNDGILTYNTALTEGVVESDFRFDSNLKLLVVSGSADIYTAMTIKRTFSAPITPETGMLYVSASGAGGALMYYNGASWTAIAAGL